MKKTLGLGLVLAALAAAQSIIIKTSTVLDGKGGVLKGKTIVVNGSKIASVSSARGNPTYDLSGLTVMPGWIDTHVHLGWYFDRANRLAQSGPQAALYAEPGEAPGDVRAGRAGADLLFLRFPIPIPD